MGDKLINQEIWWRGERKRKVEIREGIERKVLSWEEGREIKVENEEGR